MWTTSVSMNFAPIKTRIKRLNDESVYEADTRTMESRAGISTTSTAALSAVPQMAECGSSTGRSITSMGTTGLAKGFTKETGSGYR